MLSLWQTRPYPALRNKNNNPRYQQKKSYSYRGRDRQTRGNTAEIESNDEQGRNTFHASINSPKDESEEGGSSMEQMTWLLDSGCSDHIVNDDKCFSIYRNLTKPVDIKEGDRFIIQALGIGTIDVNFKVDSKFVNVQIKNCYYAPAMKKNLLSVSKMTDFGNTIWAKNNFLEIYNSKNEIIAVAHKKQGLYYLIGSVDLTSSNNHACISEITNKENWHKRLGHISFHNLDKMCRDQIVQGLPKTVENVFLKCEVCLSSKMSNSKFKNDRSRAKSVGEIIHTDVNGPMSPEGLNGEKYFVSFIDDLSRSAIVYCIKIILDSLKIKQVNR